MYLMCIIQTLIDMLDQGSLYICYSILILYYIIYIYIYILFYMYIYIIINYYD